VDFKKAFDSIDRTLLFQKLQEIDIPYKFCASLFHIFNNTRIFVQAGLFLSAPFVSNIGTPQGDAIAAILFSLFLSDLPRSIPDIGPLLGTTRISLIMYADDLVLIAETSDDLQKMIDALKTYCDDNRLTVNISKTKCMIFHRGRCPKTSFQYNGQELEIVKSFTYLGFIFTVQLSFTKHLEAQIVKARSRVGQLFVRLPLMDLPLDLVLKTFAVYVIPIFLYGLPMWLNACSKSAICSMDAIFTKYLKRYVHLPPWANNAKPFPCRCT